MKQSITREQIDELTKSEKSKLEDLFNTDPVTNKITPKKYQWNVYPSEVNIGWMIEFLSTNDGVDYLNITEWTEKRWRVSWFAKNRPLVQYSPQESTELCDALWEAVKEVLNKENK